MAAAVPYLVETETLMQVALTPADTVAPLNAVQRQLNRLLFAYDEKLGGVPVAYGELEFPEGREYGRYMADYPWVHIDVLTRLVVFTPVPRTRVNGKIIKVSDNHVALHIFSLFNASIAADEMRKKFKFNPTLLSWESKTDSDVTWKEGDIVEFTISSFQHANGVLNITGAL